jgi:ABC-type uncharacterized transport system permease subunit
MRRIVVSVLPFAFVASYPCVALFQGLDWGFLAHTVAVLGGSFTFMAWLWRRGLRAYSSASS